MYKIVQQAHSGWAYLALLLLLIAAVNGLIGFFSKREFKQSDRRIGLFALIAVHVQLLIGLILYFVSPLGKASLGQMSDSTLRLTSMEHPLINLLAIVLITVGWSKHKKQTESAKKFHCFALFYSLGLTLILIRIPWNLWFPN